MVRTARPSIRASSNGVLRHFDFNSSRSRDPGHVQVDHHHVGRSARTERPAGQAQQFGGLVESALSTVISLSSPVCVQPERRRQQRLEADRAEGGFLERQALVLDLLRIVAGDDDVDQPVARAPATSALRSSSLRSGGESLAKVR